MNFIDEIMEQPDALKAVIEYYYINPCKEAADLKDLLETNTIEQVVFTGMGSSLFASYVPCSYLRSKGIKVFALESCELVKFHKELIDSNTLLIAVSQSGESRETVEAANTFTNIAKVVTVINAEGRSLSNQGRIKFNIQAGREITSANKTYTNTIAVLMQIAYIIAGADTAEIQSAGQFLEKCYELMRNILNSMNTHISNIYDFLSHCKYLAVVGSGPSYSTASQGELIMVEAVRQYCSRFTVNQFIHGPLEIIDGNFGAIVIDFDQKMEQEINSLIRSVIEYGGRIWLVTNRDRAPQEGVILTKIDCEVHALSPVIEMIPLELFINEMGLRRNMNPGILTRVAK